MTLELSQLAFFGFAYLALLFLVAQLTESGRIPERIVRHPVTYVLSLGIIASAWAYYGVVSLAHEYGFAYLSYYLGISGVFFLTPLILMPIHRISRSYMHSSLADLLAFRFHSQSAGSLITLCMLIAVLPMLALQLQAISDSAQILLTGNAEQLSADNAGAEWLYCATIAIAAISLGARHVSAHQPHKGLMTTLALESLIKLFILLTLGAAAVFGVFGGFGQLDQWLLDNPVVMHLLHSPIKQGSARTLLLMFFAAVVVMPHMYHMVFAQRPNNRQIHAASWGAPLFLLLISLPVLPILFAGYINNGLPPEYYALGVSLQLELPWLALLTFVGGMSAASSVIVVMSLALASMCLKHLVLPFYRPGAATDMYRWLLWVRRALIATIIMAGYGFYQLMGKQEALPSIGLAAFIATLQFLPGVLAALYWTRANHQGFIAGLIGGFGIWAVVLLRPFGIDADPGFLSQLYFDAAYTELWHSVALISLAVNCLLLIGISLLTKTSVAERQAADACASSDISRSQRRQLTIRSPEEMKNQLATAIGQLNAEREIEHALAQLQLPADETRPSAMRQLRARIETNLSAQLGPVVAREMMETLLPYLEAGSDDGDDLNLLEVELERRQSSLTGVAADLDNLRRHYRQTLQELPVGLCSLGSDQEILMWNNAMASFTGISAEQVVGSHLQDLPRPWQQLLSEFIASPSHHKLKQQLEIDQQQHRFHLHKTIGENNRTQDGQLIVLEDTTDLQRLERELTHTERLASIGRLAAGVAHEIGNPVTGIACLAQNLRYDTDNPSSLQTADEILNQTRRITTIVQSLMNFAHGGDQHRERRDVINVHDCIGEAVNLLSLDKDAKAMVFDNQCDPGLMAHGDYQRLLQVFINLINNARDASPANSSITFTSERQGQQLAITITDHGEGISERHLQHIFEPFFTTKETGQGTGLGLYLVYNIIEEMNGQISAASPAHHNGSGTRFTVKLPAQEINDSL